MAGTAGGDAVGKLGQARPAAERDALHLDIGVGQPVAGQQEIDPARLAIGHFGPHAVIVGQRRDLPRLQRRTQRAVGQRGVDAGEMPALVLDQPPAVFQLLASDRRSAPARSACPARPAPASSRDWRNARSPRARPPAGSRPGTACSGGSAGPAQEGFESAWRRGLYLRSATFKGEQRMANPTAAMLVIGDEILSGPHPRCEHALPGRAADQARHRPEGSARGQRRRGRDHRRRRARCRAASITSSPPAGSARPMTTSPPTASPRPSTCPSTCATMRARCWWPITPRPGSS